MGFTGHYVFGRSDRPLREAPVFDQASPASPDDIHECWPRAGGWQTLQLTNGLWQWRHLDRLVEWSGASACVAYIYDSDVAMVDGLDQDGRRWEAHLNAEIAAEYDEVDPQRWLADYQATIPSRAEAAIAWARSAGFGCDAQDQIEQLMRSEETFAEDLFVQLLDALNFPAAVDPEPADGAGSLRQ